MSRLTKKEKNRLSCHQFKECDYLRNGTPRIKTLTKLGKLEDLEDEIGCPLEVVFKALKEGSIEDENGGIQIVGITIGGDGELYLHAINGDLYLLKNYGKTCWLKEDRSE